MEKALLSVPKLVSISPSTEPDRTSSIREPTPVVRLTKWLTLNIGL